MLVSVQLQDLVPVLQRLEQFGSRAARYASQAISTTARDTAAAARREVRAATAMSYRVKGPSGSTGAGLPRIFWSARRERATGSVWVGMNDIRAGNLQPFIPRDMNPVAQSNLPGAYAGRKGYFFRGAFVARMPSGYLSIFKRTGEKHRPAQGSHAGKLREKLQEEGISSQAAGLGGLSSSLQQFAAARLEREMARQMARLGGER